MIEGQRIMTESTERLIERARSGDLAAVQLLLHRHSAQIDSWCRRLLFPPEEDVEDAAQEVCLEAQKSICKFEGRSAFSTWLFPIARRVCSESLRKRCRRRGLEVDLDSGDHEEAFQIPDPGLTPEEIAERRAYLEAARARLDSLDPREREIVMLSVYDGMKSAEIARIIGITEGRVRQILIKIRDQGEKLDEK